MVTASECPLLYEPWSCPRLFVCVTGDEVCMAGVPASGFVQCDNLPHPPSLPADELLVDLDGSQSSPTPTSPSTSQLQNRHTHILSSPLRGSVTNPLDPLGLGLDQGTGEGGMVLNPLDPLGLGLGEGEGEAGEDVKALVKVSSDSDSEGRRPVRPAPPKPRPQKPPPKTSSKKKLSGGEGGVAGKVSPPSLQSPSEDTAPMLTSSTPATTSTNNTTRPPKPPR